MNPNTPNSVQQGAAPAQVGGLRQALEAMAAYVEERDPLQTSAEYDRIADAFYAQTRLWPPGRSMPAAMGGQSAESGEKALREWRPFCNAWHERRTKEMRDLIASALAAPTPEYVSGWLAGREAICDHLAKWVDSPSDYRGVHGILAALRALAPPSAPPVSAPPIDEDRNLLLRAKRIRFTKPQLKEIEAGLLKLGSMTYEDDAAVAYHIPIIERALATCREMLVLVSETPDWLLLFRSVAKNFTISPAWDPKKLRIIDPGGRVTEIDLDPEGFPVLTDDLRAALIKATEANHA